MMRFIGRRDSDSSPINVDSKENPDNEARHQAHGGSGITRIQDAGRRLSALETSPFDRYRL